MTYRNSIASKMATCRKNMQEPTFTTGLRSHRNYIIVAEGGMRKTLLTYSMQDTLNWMGYWRGWRTFLHVFNLCMTRKTKVLKFWKKQILKAACVYRKNKCNENIDCVQKKPGRGIHKSSRYVCKRGQPSVEYTPKRTFQVSYGDGTLFNAGG